MARFLTPLRATKVGKRTWVVDQPLMYESTVAQRVFIVPEGFVTDLASVPRIPLAFLLTGGTADEAAVVHDFIYSRAIVPRELADAVFKEAALVTGEPPWRAWLMWAG